MADPSLKSSDSATPPDGGAAPSIDFVCNICGLANRVPLSRIDREVGSCNGCESTVRTRAVAHMISREMFGIDLAIPDFPQLRGIRGMGISDSPDYAGQLASKFTYRNTYYHKEPRFDILNVPEYEWGTYDFVIASEVFEHVAPPVNVPFEHAWRLLKPGGLFFFTVPYTLAGKTTEHFPDLHDHRVVEFGGSYVMVNRTRDGRIQVFDDLVFHGGGGSTLELRVFTEGDLRKLMSGAGFTAVEIYGGNYEPFGIVRTENWSLPMTARKQPFGLTNGALTELVEQWRGLKLLTEKLVSHRTLLESQVEDANRELRARTDWAVALESQLGERTAWAVSLEQDVARHVEIAERVQRDFEERTGWALKLRDENETLTERLNRMNASRWIKLGRALGMAKES